MKKVQSQELVDAKKELVVAQTTEKSISMQVKKAVSEQQLLVARIHKLIFRITEKRHVEVSAAEKKYFRELEDTSSTINGLKATIQQVCSLDCEK